MKTLKTFFFVAVAALVLVPTREAEAQLWDKIKKKTQDKVENVIVDKTSDKAAEITAKKMDQALSADFNFYGKGDKKKDVSDLPESYAFEWKYQVQIKQENPDSKGAMVLDYYLAPDQTYFGFTMEQLSSLFSLDGFSTYTMH